MQDRVIIHSCRYYYCRLPIFTSSVVVRSRPRLRFRLVRSNAREREKQRETDERMSAVFVLPPPSASAMGFYPFVASTLRQLFLLTKSYNFGSLINCISFYQEYSHVK
jgi:hypothetical protein